MDIILHYYITLIIFEREKIYLQKTFCSDLLFFTFYSFFYIIHIATGIRIYFRLLPSVQFKTYEKKTIYRHIAPI